jgi:hypothetical protein
MKSKQVPIVIKVIGQQHYNRKEKEENGKKTYITATRKQIRQYQRERSRTPPDEQF